MVEGSGVTLSSLQRRRNESWYEGHICNLTTQLQAARLSHEAPPDSIRSAAAVEDDDELAEGVEGVVDADGEEVPSDDDTADAAEPEADADVDADDEDDVVEAEADDSEG